MSTGLGVRILAVGNMYPPHHFGGYELVWRGAMARAREAGCEVRVLTSDFRNPSVAEPDDPGVHRDLRWYWSWEDYDAPRLSLRQRWQVERHNASLLARHLEAFRPDVVSWWSMGGMSQGLLEQVRRRVIPAVSVVHDDWLAYGTSRDAWARLWAGRGRRLAAVAEHATGLPTRVGRDALGRTLFNSEYTRRRAEEAGTRLSDTAVVTPGIDGRFLTAHPPPSWRWRLGYVGRIDVNKGIDTAVQALALLPEAATLEVVGEGDPAYVETMRERARDLGAELRLRFRGPLRGDDLVAAYADVDAVVFPVRWEEPWGLVPLEAMGVGRPVLATARGGSAEYLRDEQNALRFPPDDAPALAATVCRLAGDAQLRARLRQGGLDTAAQHTAERFERRIVDELQNAAAAARGY